MMEDIVSPLASIMAAIVALAMGGFVGYFVSYQLMSISTYVADNSILGLPDALELLIAFLVTGVLFWATLRFVRRMAIGENQASSPVTVRLVLPLLAIVLAIIAAGFLSQFGILAGEWLSNVLQVGTFLGIEFFGFLGNLVFVLSDLILFLLPAAIALLVGLIAASYAARFSQEAVISWPTPPARTLTAVLAFLGSVAIVYGIGAFWNWLYEFESAEATILMPSIVGGAVTGILLMTLLRFKSRLARLLNGIVVAALAIFGLLEASAFINELLNLATVSQFMATPALISGLVATILASLSRPNHPYGVGFAIYTVSRAILNALRSIEPLIMAIVFVVWVSLGPFAGIMALILHSIAALGKLFSEQVEGIDDGPVEAIIATGASRIQMIVYAVIPQVVPPFTAFALYRWDINVRMSTIIGFVGGGGIGFILAQNIQRNLYRQASVNMLAIAIVVATLDYASAKIRSRII